MKSRPSRFNLGWRFALTGATIGLPVGLLEAGLLDFIPRATGLAYPDVRYVIWFLAPMVDLIAGAGLGLILGALACLRKRSANWVFFFAAIGIGLAGAYVTWLLDWFRIGTGVIFPRRLEISTPIEFFLIIFILVLILLAIFRNRFKQIQRDNRPRLRWLGAIVIALIALTAGVVFCAAHRLFNSGAQVRTAAASHLFQGMQVSHPNVVLIVLDTVRADHLSCYGYSRPTTPNLDRLAARGVLFENAISPSSWTLPSITSIFTGLMPHQSGADWGRPPDPAPWPLARILQSEGYETAGFNSNPFYGLGGWRLSEGFDVYEDDSYSIRHNLAVTLIGQSVLRALYDRLIRYNQFDRRSAADVNRDVIRWARHRDHVKPFFLFINYMDAHRPYLPPASFDHRFGRIPQSLLSRVSAVLNNGHPPRPYTTQERMELIDGYDNSLAYLDHEIGRLVDFLAREPRGGQTIFIVTSDHGEGFGEHGTYDHGWNLYQEVLRVPLIIAGPGIEPDARVQNPVPDRDLFSTVLDLTLGLKGAIERTSLRRYWESGFKVDEVSSKLLKNPPKLSFEGAAGGPKVAKESIFRARFLASLGMTGSLNDGVVSELDIFSRGADPAALSLTTPQWHLILASNGQAELYNRQRDPGEKMNLAADPGQRDTLTKLQTALESRIGYSLLPWRAVDYLSPLDQPGTTFIQKISSQRLGLPSLGIPIGSAQSIFSHQPPAQLIRPSPAEQDTLRALPYH